MECILKGGTSPQQGGSFAPRPLTEEFMRDWSAGVQVLSSYQNSTFFSWDRGSTLNFLEMAAPPNQFCSRRLLPFHHS